ncbi:MAG: hypothetical protein Ct9H300mP15_01160 [Gemmatimonadota bacterium]|nr:MAG: hypothetical protein Ct9H300mP15_01160 [Gemmatimonadota bacterium]
MYMWGFDTCGGARYNRNFSKYGFVARMCRRYSNNSDRGIRFFIRERKLGQKLWQLEQVGLGYLRLGQAATTLSGGKLSVENCSEFTSAAGKRGRKLYILDEPTLGFREKM